MIPTLNIVVLHLDYIYSYNWIWHHSNLFEQTNHNIVQSVMLYGRTRRPQGKRSGSCGPSSPSFGWIFIAVGIDVDDVFFLVYIMYYCSVDNFKSNERILFYWQVARRDLLDFQRWTKDGTFRW